MPEQNSITKNVKFKSGRQPAYAGKCLSDFLFVYYLTVRILAVCFHNIFLNKCGVKNIDNAVIIYIGHIYAEVIKCGSS